MPANPGHTADSLPTGLGNAVAEEMRRIAAAEMMPRFRQLADHEVSEKGPGDLVTVVDRACEAALTERLAALLPDSLVVGEEAVAADSDILDRLEGAAPVWIVDPLDGTANFAAGRDRFGMIVALARGGRVLAGWIYHPLGDRMAIAMAGQGVAIDGRPVAAPDAGLSLDRMRVRGNPRALSRRYGTAAGSRLQGSVASIDQIRCAALDYLDLMDNKVGLVLTQNGKPWDHAAGVLMHVERGGVARLLNGDAYVPRVERETLLLAPDEACWHTVRGLLAG